MLHPDTELRHLGPELQLGVAATRLIPRGTIVWAMDPLDRSFTPGELQAMGPRTVQLVCGTPMCRGRVRADDLPQHVDRYDAIVRAAFPSIARVPQPLWDFVTEQQEIQQGLARPETIPSCRANYFPDPSLVSCDP